ncbi:tyrosine decarboxylase MfnA [Methanospirillum lacunae]|uniref:Probable L-tyrosine/L-aspartate decarboxylase n=1 Tax=Methanospirillum lacunae TaxID=668570 RepID=A0A2V2N8U5_9EURY|nr:tyrosine decarboxylase MfnA [Methanospirillum lacunae]PWR72011.1 tyrosine decarboxylase MfnA [Methanospirillum lacunae]
MVSDGISSESLFCFLEECRRRDICWDHILSSMCTPPHQVAVRAHNLFMETNLGDPGLFPGTAHVDELLIRWFGDLYHAPDAGGCSTSGGTESNIQVLRFTKAAKKSDHPNIIVPASAHFSFEKACRMMGIEMRVAPLDGQYRMDIPKTAELVDKDTCCLIGIAGTTEYGMTDPIPALGKLAEEEDIHLHVDAAFGGLVLPFLKDAPQFDFKVSGVGSISVDPHKMGMSTIPSGVLMVRDEACFCNLLVDTPYLTVKQSYSLSGTRPGASVAGAYAVLAHFGKDGMEAIVAGCMENTRRLTEGMEAYGVKRKITPDVNVATFEHTEVPEPWAVSYTRSGDLRIVCMPHVHRDVIEKFLSEFGEFHDRSSN